MNRSRHTRDRRIAARLPRRRLLALNSDDRLVELVIEGDEMAFELLYARHVADALAFADGLLGSREQAEQAVRHSFAAAHAYLADGGHKTAFEPWLYTILDNHCLSMLQRRRGGSGAPEEQSATVVDLAEWRRKRKLMGAALPVAPSAGFHDSVMTACGIGGGAAAAASAPLLAGTLAKVAVVALLAGGAGVAGDVVSDRNAPVEAKVAQAPSSPTVDPDGALSVGGLPAGQHPSAVLGAGGSHLALPVSSPQRSPDGLDVAPVDGPAGAAIAAPVGQSPGLGVARRPDGARVPDVGPAPPEEAPADVPSSPLPPEAPSVVEGLGERLKETLPKVRERLRAHLPRLDKPLKDKPLKDKPPGAVLPQIEPPVAVKPPKVKLPDVVKLPKVGDDMGVIPVKPPVDVGALLRRGLGVPPA